MTLREWWRAWWHDYSGSVILVMFILISIAGFWRLDRADERNAENAARLVEQKTALARHEVQVAKQLADTALHILRQASLDGCARDNQMRERWRVWARAQLAVTRSTGTETAPDLSLAQFFALRDREEAALRRLYGELAPIDCEQAYPPVVVDTTGGN